MNEKARTPKQERGVRSKRRLLDAGKRLFSRHGYNGIHAADIAKEAGAAVGSFYAYFNDKRDMFLALLDEYNEEIMAAEEELFAADGKRGAPGDLRGFIGSFVHAVIRSHRESADFFKEVLRMAPRDDEVKKRVDAIDDRARKLLEHSLKALPGMSGKKARQIAFVVYYASEGVIHRCVTEQDDVDEKAAAGILTDLIHAYLGGIAGGGNGDRRS